MLLTEAQISIETKSVEKNFKSFVLSLNNYVLKDETIPIMFCVLSFFELLIKTKFAIKI